MCNPFYTTVQFAEHWLHLKPRTVTVYMQTSAFSFYLQNHINNYKQTTENTVCVNYDYATGYNTAVIQFFLWQQVNSLMICLAITCFVLLVALSYTNCVQSKW